VRRFESWRLRQLGDLSLRLRHRPLFRTPSDSRVGQTGFVADTESARPFVFLSYAHGDREAAALIRQQLSDAGIRVWDPMASLGPGDDWRATIQEAVKAADAVVVLQSRNAAQSNWVPTELAAAVAAQSRDSRKRIIPVRIDSDVGTMPLLERYQAIDMSQPGKTDEGVAQLTTAILDESSSGRDGLFSTALEWESLEAETRAWDLAREIQRELVIGRVRQYEQWLSSVAGATAVVLLVAFIAIVVNTAQSGSDTLTALSGAFVGSLATVFAFVSRRRQ
jgi:hypothetical protein